MTLAREMRREGRSVARVNGRSVKPSLLRELGAFLVDIHGQSEHLSLLNVRQHLGLLDRFAGVEAAGRLPPGLPPAASLRRELNDLRQSEQEKARRIDLLHFQVEEIEAASLKPGEEDDLRHERDRLANAESLAQLAQQGAGAAGRRQPGIARDFRPGRAAGPGPFGPQPDRSQPGRAASQAIIAAETLGEIGARPADLPGADRIQPAQAGTGRRTAGFDP